MNLIDLGEKVIDYIKDDLTHWYGLRNDVTVKISGEDATKLFGKQERMVCVGKLTIWSDTTDNKIVLTAHPFEANEELWNGPNVIPNSEYESMLASLFHDLLYSYMESIAKQLNVSVGEVRKWADKVLFTIWYNSTDSKWEKFKARVGYGVVRTFGGIFHNLGKLFCLLAMLLLISGCCVPDWELTSVEGGKAVQEQLNGDK